MYICIRKLVAIILTTATLLYMACSVSMAVEYPCEGVANTKSVRIRKKASTSGERSGELKEGESVTVLEEIVHKNGKAKSILFFVFFITKSDGYEYWYF